MLDLTGQKYGLLTVLEEAPRNGNKRAWVCECECGTIKTIRQSDLRSGKTLSCGCLGKQKRAEATAKIKADRRTNPKPYNDLTGRVFSRLTVLEFDKEYTLQQRAKNPNDRFSYWKCQCECGNVITVQGTALTNKHVQSCGCLQREKAAIIMKNEVQPKGAAARIVDITGQRFGKLVAVSLVEDPTKERAHWLCQCDCGGTKIVPYSSLVNGGTTSCGCLGKSRGEDLIKNLLTQYNINFKQEVSFADLKDINRLRFDFGIYDNENNLIKLIEYNGRQHTDTSSKWYSEEVKKHDAMKIEYCQKNNIPLLVIPYQDFDKVTIEYLGVL